ncbi:gamma-glutamylcyclotransferase activity [Nesidiocoris tenuis]|uniref:gamma-glutamylcyclotransferase n=1 Tax=Nesidiocoris tenuis TaxID=355587 RepID=A0ABN7B3H5_9HEMI|nr:gamma-glutamylcyclotransferase activity [Nesidiocoris tenuis]
MSGRKFVYFAYDNLMLSNRMLCCVQRDARRLGLGKLANHKLTFGHFSPDWYGTLPTIKKSCDCVVWGTLWELNECYRAKLDEVQGVKKGLYVPMTVEVSTVNAKGGTFPATTHKLKLEPADPELFEGVWRKKDRPSKLYHEELIDGAEESCLPVYYRKWLKRIPHNGYTGSIRPNLKDVPSPTN